MRWIFLSLLLSCGGEDAASQATRDETGKPLCAIGLTCSDGETGPVPLRPLEPYWGTWGCKDGQATVDTVEFCMEECECWPPEGGPYFDNNNCTEGAACVDGVCVDNCIAFDGAAPYCDQ
jgi:hypothetical protein